ncbi:hypothetical protein V6N13_049003 [Hibiscus sabdariffa]|uniref:Uncharacterized protein n=1 Tax=Hibiscus sabdariffa TaxID=183260 RepID=A0ABR2QYD1_9ROSI
MNNVQEKLSLSVFESPSLRVLTDTSTAIPSSSFISTVAGVPFATIGEVNMCSHSYSSNAQYVNDGVYQTPVVPGNVGSPSTITPLLNAQDVNDGVHQTPVVVVHQTHVVVENVDAPSTACPPDFLSPLLPTQSSHTLGKVYSFEHASSSGSLVNVHELQCGESLVNDGPSQDCDAQDQNATIPVS